MDLKEHLKNKKSTNKEYSSFEVKVFDFNNEKDKTELLHLFDKGLIGFVVDEYNEQLLEVSVINNPKIIFDKNLIKDVEYTEQDGVWVYYSWRRSLVHCLDKNDYIKLKTSRNYNLILPEELSKVADLKIGVAGLNVGNPGAVCLALEGVGSHFKLADIDVLSVSNLNRFRAGICDLGVNKSNLSARQILEINPFNKVEVYSEGIKEDELDDFLLDPKLDILIEEMDNLELKIKIRERAKELKIPVLMVTGNSESVIIDVERYDKEEVKLLNGHIADNVVRDIKFGIKSIEQKITLAQEFMGDNVLRSRLVDSFGLVGKELAGIPQLAESSFMRGSAICYFTRNIFLEDIPSGRYFLNIHNIIN